MIHTNASTGNVIAVRGAVVDVQFNSKALPAIDTVLIVDWYRPEPLVLEVYRHTDPQTVRGIALQATMGLARKTRIRATGTAVSQPVDDAVLGRLFDVVGTVRDNEQALPGDTPHRSIHNAPPALENENWATRARSLKVVMITDNNQGTAERIAKTMGINTVLADVLPDDKASKIRELQAQGKKDGMVDDGVNDAPVLTLGDVGFAIGAGTDVKMESADVVLIKSDPFEVVDATELSRATLEKMHQNLWWVIGYSYTAFLIAAGVLYSWPLGPSIAAIAMSDSTAVVAINARILKRTKLSGIAKKGSEQPDTTASAPTVDTSTTAQQAA